MGSRNERPGITGISHLFEHMMFNGSERYGPKEFDRVLEAHGGASNAYTSNDVTAYHDDFATDALPVVIDLESDRMRALRITEDGLAQERSVVMEERRLRTENSHFGLLEEQLDSLVYQAHPYRWPVIGWMDDIARIGRDDCLAFFRTYYAPGNASIYVCGDVDPDDLLRRIEGAYGGIPPGPPVPPPIGGEPVQRGERRAADPTPRPGRRHAGGVPGSGGAGSRHGRARRAPGMSRHRGRAPGCAGGSSRRRRWRCRWASAGPGAPTRACSCSRWSSRRAPRRGRRRRRSGTEIDRVAQRGVSARELDRARALLRSSLLHEFATRNGVAHALGQAEALLGDWREAGRALERYQAVTREDVRRCARTWLAPPLRNVVWLEPEPVP